MTDIDELDINPFFRLLQTTFHREYEIAEDNCYVVCVPQSSSLAGANLSRSFVECHILKPSPYFKSQFFTLGSQVKIVHIDENGKTLLTKEGFPTEKSVSILNEELGYNKEYKPFKILILEEPLDSSFLPLQTSSGPDGPVYAQCNDFEECKKFLDSYAEYWQVMKSLRESLNVFNTRYMVLKDFLDDVKQKLQQISSQATEDCCKCSKMSLWSDPRFRDSLSSSIESFVMGSVHQKVFPVICEKFASDNAQLHKKCLQLQSVTPHQLGVDLKLSCPLPSSISLFSKLGLLKTPLEKLHCLKSTVDCVTKEIQTHIEQNRQPAISPYLEEAAPCLTSDDLIPILVSVIAQTKCDCLESNIFYMEYFHWSTDTKDRDSLSYHLVSFKAAVEYMKNTNFDHLHDKEVPTLIKTGTKKQMEISARPENGSTQYIGHGGAKNDEKVDKISKLLENSNLNHMPCKKQDNKGATQSIFGEEYKTFLKNPEDIPKKDTKEKKEKLGDFLSSLDDDIFDVSFGKQT